MLKIKTKILLIPLSLASLLWFAPALVYADNPAKGAIQCGVNNAAGVNNCTATPSTSLDHTISSVINILSVIVGVLAVIMIIVAGFRYVTSAGNDQAIAGAKRTLLYAIIGLVIVALAQVIAVFVLSKTTSTSSSSSGSSTTLQPVRMGSQFADKVLTGLP